jgi:branched-chain amino acid transport system permease protein
VARAVLTALKLALLLAAVLLVVSLPRFMGEYRLSQFTYVAIYFIALLGLNILTGYNGQISLGHGAFMGIGAYTSALLTLGRPGLEFLQLHPPGWLPLGDGMRSVFTIPIAGLVAGAIGFLFGFPALRLAGVSLALATFAVAVSLPTVAKRFDELTGGGGGLVLNLPTTPFGLDVSVRHWLYYQAWATAGILFLVAWLLVRGRVGRAWRAIRDGEIAAVSSGVSPAAYKTLAFGISSAYAGVAGALLAIEVSYVNPDTFPVSLSILLLASVVVGGLASLSGVIFGALLLQFLPIYVQDPPLVSFEFSRQAPSVVFGAILILIVFAVPGGVAGLLQRIVRRLTTTVVRRPSPEKGLIVSPGRSEGA